MTKRNSLTFKLKICFFLIAFVFGLSHAWATRFAVDPDGLSYLDIGDTFFRGDFKGAISTYWSPLYSLILGSALHLFKPSSYWESTLVHFVNFFIFLFAFFCFEFFLRGFVKYQENKKYTTFPGWMWLSLGYSLFLWVSFNLVSISKVTPDMLVSAIVYLISGIIVRIKSGSQNFLLFVCLGFLLGVGYLAKAAMFPIGFMFLVVSFFAIGNIKRAMPRILIAFFVFMLVSGPLIYAVSKKAHHLTFSEIGKLTYAWYTNTAYECWRSGYPNCPKLPHPARKISTEPLVYEYATPIIGSYPVWYNPAYWFCGLKPHFNLVGQLVVLKRSLGEYFELFFHMMLFLTFACLVLFYITGRKWKCFKDITSEWIFLAPAIFSIVMYSLVMIKFRYLGPFILLFWLGIFSALRLSDSKPANSIIIVLVTILLFTSGLSYDFLKEGKNASALMHYKVASELEKSGVKSGDKVGVVGLEYGLYWVRLAKCRVIAEIPTEEENNFWLLDDKSKVYEKFKNAGAKILVSERGPSNLSKIGWRKIDGTSYYILFL